MPFKAKQYSRETALSMVKEGSCLGKEVKHGSNTRD
jgi:hypothetical protein